MAEPRTSELTASGFNGWCRFAVAGDQLTYHRGFLPRDKDGLSDRVAHLAEAALRCFGAGLVHLVQQRRGDLDFEYLAIKRG